jgi:hypothetical protein
LRLSKESLRFSNFFQKWKILETARSKNFKNFKKTLDKHSLMCYNKYSKGEVKMKKDKRERKMTPEQLQGLLHMRKRGFVQKNGKAYNRKVKHKNREER